MSTSLQERLEDTMIELANRDAVHEAAMLRVARAGELEGVVKHIMRMRKYVKTHSPNTRAREPHTQKATAKPRRRKANAGQQGPHTAAGTSTT